MTNAKLPEGSMEKLIEMTRYLCLEAQTIDSQLQFKYMREELGKLDKV